MTNEQMTSITVKLSKQEKEFLQQYARSNDQNLSQVVRRAIREFLANK